MSPYESDKDFAIKGERRRPQNSQRIAVAQYTRWNHRTGVKSVYFMWQGDDLIRKIGSKSWETWELASDTRDLIKHVGERRMNAGRVAYCVGYQLPDTLVFQWEDPSLHEVNRNVLLTTWLTWKRASDVTRTVEKPQITPDPFDQSVTHKHVVKIELRLCDDDGMVSNRAIIDSRHAFGEHSYDDNYLERSNRLREGTPPLLAATRCGGELWIGGQVYKCTSAAHSKEFGPATQTTTSTWEEIVKKYMEKYRTRRFQDSGAYFNAFQFCDLEPPESLNHVRPSGDGYNRATVHFGPPGERVGATPDGHVVEFKYSVGDDYRTADQQQATYKWLMKERELGRA